MDISNISGCNLIGLSSSLAILIGQNLDVDDLTILSAFFNSLSDNLAIIATTRPSSNTSEISDSEN